LFEDWPEANDMAVSVYVVLTADPSSSHRRWLMLHVADKNLTPRVPRGDGLAPRRQRHINLVTRNPKIWEHRVGDQKERKNLLLETMPRCLHGVVVIFWRLILMLALCVTVCVAVEQVPSPPLSA
jgi:hypothetical protein